MKTVYWIFLVGSHLCLTWDILAYNVLSNIIMAIILLIDSEGIIF